MRPFYRARQFWSALTARPSPADLELAGVELERLSPALLALFLRMQASEQAHSVWIMRQLLAVNCEDHDLLTAALLHDVGKVRYPLRIWERAVIVLGKTLAPQWVKRWGQAPPCGWKRPFVVAEQHPAWGAEMAAQAGASALAVRLIRRHQDILKQPWAQPEDPLLYQLQFYDNES